MGSILIGTGAGLFGAALLWLRYGHKLREEAPVSDFQRKLNFIRDVCDGNLKKSNALLTEKMALDATLSYEQAVESVYLDMLELTNEERAAVLKYGERRKGERRQGRRAKSTSSGSESAPQ
jgi:hypothetical protein